MRRVLVVGYGSIGQRHARILTEQGYEVGVCSRRSVCAAHVFGTIEQALSVWKPDYVVLASQTHEHAGNLQDLAAQDFTGSVLVEKPLFDHPTAISENVFKALHVAYNLRFHPLFERLREALEGEDILSYQAYVGQYLPTWRPGVDYRESYSASHEKGGGALRDLSHDLDYTRWLLGNWTHLTAQGGQVSDLEITSDDCFMVMMKTQRCPLVSIQMNYLDRDTKREILIHTNRHSFHVDLVAGTFKTDGVLETISTQRDHTYSRMHEELCHGYVGICATAEDGLAVIDMLAAIETANRTKTWITA